LNIMKKNNLKSVLAGIMAAFIVGSSFMSLAGCSSSDNTDKQTDTASVTDKAEETTTAEPEEETTDAETTAEPETETTEETTAEETEESEETTAEETEKPEETTAASTDKPSDDYTKGGEDKTEDGEASNGESAKAVELAEGVNPLTGLYTGNDYADKRPVAIMINNIKQSLPQVGISEADIIYECQVEGGITRLMMVEMDYEDLGVVGSIRSSRDYYVDLAQNHDAVYIHAGGSFDAYEAIQTRKINSIDGVNGPNVPGVFYRDEERRKTMSVEHTLVTTGKNIVMGIKTLKYRTTLRNGFASPFAFASEDEQINLGGTTAKHVIVPYSNYQFPQYIYNANTQRYTRYQFNGIDHIDGATGEKLTFKNIIVLICDQTNLNDDKNHIAIDTTGTGKGYYITNGHYTEIKWSKADRDANLVLTNTDGTPLVINAGNNMINIVSPSVADRMFFNYVKEK